MEFKDKLEKYVTELPFRINWFGQKNKLKSIDDYEAVLTYNVDHGKADSRVHFYTVTLNLYVSNVDTHTADLFKLGYEQPNDTEIDDHRNNMAMYTKQVIVL